MSEPAPLVLSASTLKTWLSCEYRYLLENVWRLPASPSLEMIVGTAVHAGAEAMHNGKDGPEAARSSFERETGGGRVSSVAGDLENVVAMTEIYRAKILPTFTGTVMVEQDFLVRLNGVLVSGRIDAADERDVRDLKTTGTLSRFRPDRHRLQMSLYAHGFAAITGRKPVRLLLDVVARNLRWKTVEIEPDDGELADVLALASRGILEGAYEPTGVWTGACQRCPYALEVCTYARID